MRRPRSLPLLIALSVAAGACDDGDRAPLDAGWTNPPPDVVDPPRPDAGFMLRDVPRADVPAPDRPVVDAPEPDVPPATLPPREAFGAGFTDLTAPIEADRPFTFMQPRQEVGPTDDVIPLFGDVDHDGADELVLSLAVGSRPTQGTPPAPSAVYRYDTAARRFTRAPTIQLPAMQPLSGALDLDGDGVTDLLALDRVGAIAWGRGNGMYAPPAPLDATPSDWGNVSFVSSFFLDDLDDDGWLDLLVGADCCRSGCIDLHALFRTGQRAFDERPELLAIDAVSKPYAVLSARFTPGERLLLSIGWSCTDPMGAPVFYHQHGEDRAQMPRFEPFDPTPDDTAFRPSPGRYPTLAFLSPMAALAEDLNGDGRLDLAVSLNPTHLLLRGTDAWPFADVTRSSGIPTTNADSGRAMIPWGVAAIDLDRDTRPDLVIAHGNDGTAWFDPPERFIGPQHVGVYWNAGGMHFTPVPDALGLGRRGQFRTVTPTDLDGDGDPDLAIGGQVELARIYRNDIDNGNGALALRLHGTTSNHLGVGAWVSAWIDGASTPLRRYVGGASNPFTVFTPRVFFGLGRASRVARVEVAWPSGYVQTLRDLASGRTVDVVEPETIAVAPAGRHLPADGRSVATIRVTPRDTAGAPRADARVEVSLTGAGTLGATARDGDGWRAQITAPSAPGSAVVTVRVDGRALGVRPRVWWD